MSQLSDAIEAKGKALLGIGVSELEKLAEAASPLPLELLLKGLLALPPVQALVTDGEEWVADHVAMFVQSAETDIQSHVSDFLKNHPELAALWGKVKPAIQSAEAKYGPNLLAALEKLKGKGMLGDLETWLKGKGVM